MSNNLTTLVFHNGLSIMEEEVSYLISSCNPGSAGVLLNTKLDCAAQHGVMLFVLHMIIGRKQIIILKLDK